MCDICKHAHYEHELIDETRHLYDECNVPGCQCRWFVRAENRNFQFVN